MKQRAIPLILMALTLTATGQVLIKQGLLAYGELDSLLRILGAFTQVRVFIGFSLYAISSLVWLKVLSVAPLSFAYPFVAASYVVIVALGWLLLGEQVTAWTAVGLALICAGVMLHATGSKA